MAEDTKGARRAVLSGLSKDAFGFDCVGLERR